MNSILQSEKVCFITGSTYDLHQHHIYFGSGLRKKSDKHGFWVWLRADQHNTTPHAIHFNREMDLKLKAECQEKFEETNSREEFMKIIGRSYL